MRFSLVFTLLCCALLYSCTQTPSSNEPIVSEVSKDSLQKQPQQIIKYGIDITNFKEQKASVQPNTTFSHILQGFLPQHQINEAAKMAKDSAKLNYVSIDKSYCLYFKEDSSLAYCVYEPNLTDYVVFDFTDSLDVYRSEKPITTEIKTITGVIEKNSNLSSTVNESIKNLMVSGELTENIASIYAWSIDFFKLYPGDKFKVIYEQHSVEGKIVGVGNIPSIVFEHRDSNYYAFRFQQGKEVGYFDENAKGTKKPFLKAPLKFSRISSGYSRKRFHPVQKRWKSHLGTDYAAPKGTPIFATASGTIQTAGFKKHNGNYVKVNHNKTYQTAYLHMTKIKGGIKSGVHVNQGDVIGFVGKTGLATGYHVCYRFWKNGKQVDPRRLKFQSNIPVKKENLEKYKKTVEEYRTKLDSLTYPTISTELSAL